MASRRTPIELRLANEGDKPVLAGSLAAALAGFQELVFHLGDARLGHDPRAGGPPRKDVQNNFSLRVTSLKTGSAVVTLAIPSSQAGLDSVLPESAQVENDVHNLLELIKKSESTPDEVAVVIPDSRRRRYVHRSIKKMIPSYAGYFLEVGVKSSRLQLRTSDLTNATRLLVSAEPEGETNLCGRITKLSVDKARSFQVDTEAGDKTVHYDHDLEDNVREALGTIARIPVHDDGKRLQFMGQAGIEILDLLPIDQFLIDGVEGKVEPPLHLDVEVIKQGNKEFYLATDDEFDLVIREPKVAGVIRSAKEALGELWDLYVAESEENLTPDAIELRHKLMARLSL